MKTPKMKFDGKMDWRALLDSLMFKIGHLNPLRLIGIGAAVLVLAVVLFFTGGVSQADNDAELDQAQQVLGQVSDQVQSFRRVLEDQQVQALAKLAATDPDKLSNLRQYISDRIPGLIETDLFPTDLSAFERVEQLCIFGDPNT